MCGLNISQTTCDCDIPGFRRFLVRLLVRNRVVLLAQPLYQSCSRIGPTVKDRMTALASHEISDCGVGTDGFDDAALSKSQRIVSGQAEAGTRNIFLSWRLLLKQSSGRLASRLLFSLSFSYSSLRSITCPRADCQTIPEVILPRRWE